MIKDTSLEAHKHLIVTGKAKTQEAFIYRKIKEYPNFTRVMLSRAFDVPINAVCGRVNSLIKYGLIKEGEKRTDKITGKPGYTLTVI